jgi:hypothetical protein
MEKQAIKDVMFGGLSEIMKNRKYYYFSSVGVNYCHFTEEGQQALREYMTLMGAKLCEAEEAELNQRAKNLVIKGLKGETV